MTGALELEFDSIVQDEIKDFTEVLEGFENGTTHEEEWQKRRLWQGIYGQRQEGVQMIRIKIPYGLGTSDQFRAIADASSDLSDGILHITTRAAVQIHFIPRGDTPELITRMAKAGVTSREACGNVPRNVTADPYAGIGADQVFNVIPAAELLFNHCLRNPYAQNFPRKFKIAFSGNDHTDYGLSYMHDIGFIASEKDGRFTFDVHAAGGLGGRPIGADLIEKDLEIEDILICTTALMRIFNEHGNRKNRNKARMKFIKDSWGLEKFIEEYKKEFNRIKDSEYGKSLIVDIPQDALVLPKDVADISKVSALVADSEWVEKCVFPQNTADTYGVRIRIRKGDLNSAQMHALCDLADKFGKGEIRTTVDQNIIIPHIAIGGIAEVYEALKALEYTNPEFHHISNVVACPGRSTCNLSVTSSKGLAESFIQAFEADPELAKTAESGVINISGCHNGCGQHALATIGFNGSSRMVGGKAVPCANVGVGGGAKEGVRAMTRRAGRVAAKKAPQALAALINLYKEKAEEGQDINSFMQTYDIKEIKAVLKPFDAVEAYEDAPELYQDFEQAEGEEYSPAVGQGECAGGVLNLVTEAFDDAKNFIKMAKDVLANGFYNDVAYNAREAVRAVMSGALIEAGETLKDFEECWAAYDKYFAKNADLPARPASLRKALETMANEDLAESLLADAEAYYTETVRVYREEKEKFVPHIEEETEEVAADEVRKLDLTGVGCPMNYVKAKLMVEQLESGTPLEIIIDAGEPYRNVPNSLQLDGHKIAQLAPINDDAQYSLIIIKDGGNA